METDIDKISIEFNDDDNVNDSFSDSNLYESVYETNHGSSESQVWSNWSACSKSCGNGKITFSRFCIDRPCSLSLSRELGCHIDGCKFNL